MPEPGKTSTRRKAVSAPTREDRGARKRDLLNEIAFLTDEQDAMKAEIDSRKQELLLLMSQDGDRAFECENVAGASFLQRRSFEVHDAKALAKLFSREQLAEQVKVTAAFYDAAEREGYRVAQAITVGVSESLSVARAKTKNAKSIRSAHIKEARERAEAKIAEHRANLKRF